MTVKIHASVELQIVKASKTSFSLYKYKTLIVFFGLFYDLVPLPRLLGSVGQHSFYPRMLFQPESEASDA